MLGMLIAMVPANGQNLVPNPGFERHSTSSPEEWTHPTGGCNHFMLGKPGAEGSHSGRRYHGLCAFGLNYHTQEASEYLSVRLMEPMQAGRTYCVSMWVRVSGIDNRFEQLDDIGWYFSSRPVNVKATSSISCSRFLMFTPQVNFRLEQVYDWVEYKTTYVAAGRERCLTIGDFLDPSTPQAPGTGPKKRKKLKRGVVPIVFPLPATDNYYVRIFYDDISIILMPEDGVCLPVVMVPTDSVVTLDSIPITDTLQVGERVILNNIFFDFDEAVLKPESYPELERLILLLNAYPSLVIRINGHTDRHGTEEYNLDLSERRAKAVVDNLIADGIAVGRLSHKGFGESQPISDDDSVNRRVEFEVVGL